MNCKINYSNFNSPYYENLVSELFRIISYKSNILEGIKKNGELQNNLTPEQQNILNDLTNSETKILLEIFKIKNLDSSHQANMLLNKDGQER